MQAWRAAIRCQLHLIAIAVKLVLTFFVLVNAGCVYAAAKALLNQLGLGEQKFWMKRMRVTERRLFRELRQTRESTDPNDLEAMTNLKDAERIARRQFRRPLLQYAAFATIAASGLTASLIYLFAPRFGLPQIPAGVAITAAVFPLLFLLVFLRISMVRLSRQAQRWLDASDSENQSSSPEPRADQ